MCSQNNKINKIDFSLLVESHARNNDLSLIESCIIIAEENDIEHNDIPKYIYQSLFDKIELEAVNNKTIKSNDKTISLTFFGI